MLDALDRALVLTEDIQRAYRQAGPSERRLFNQAFFEWLKIEDETVVSHKLAEPFDRLSGPKPYAELATEALAERLVPGWDRKPVAEGMAELISEQGLNARTSGPFFEAGGSNVESMVRAEGLEPPRSFDHQDLNLARLPNSATPAWRPGSGLNARPMPHRRLQIL